MDEVTFKFIVGQKVTILTSQKNLNKEEYTIVSRHVGLDGTGAFYKLRGPNIGESLSFFEFQLKETK